MKLHTYDELQVDFFTTDQHVHNVSFISGNVDEVSPNVFFVLL